ncbi:hypothetical protein HY061_00560 [Candidatus Azambacteria bacterium]|nr:hypothetical protein [Candidatus Azambacteria bacterium]
MNTEIFTLLKILGFSTVSFLLAMSITPLINSQLMKYGRKKTREFLDFHSSKNGTPTMGGIIIWLTVLIVIFVTFFLAKIFPDTFSKFNFLTRPQTYLPVGTLIFAALLGLFDDILVNLEKKLLRVKSKLIIFSLAGLVGGYWFHYKLGWDSIHIPFYGNFNIDGWYIPLFIFIIIASSFSANETDGLDGLLGGVMAIVFFMYTLVTFALGKYELAIFCATIVGALIAFLWFNIYPARFFMGDTGSVMLGITAGAIAMLTNTIFLLPFFMFIPMIETLSVIIQIASIKLRAGKKVFLFTPIHHHFEKLGWPETQITMRFWIINGVVSSIGLLLFVLERQL